MWGGNNVIDNVSRTQVVSNTVSARPRGALGRRPPGKGRRSTRRPIPPTTADGSISSTVRARAVRRPSKQGASTGRPGSGCLPIRRPRRENIGSDAVIAWTGSGAYCLVRCWGLRDLGDRQRWRAIPAASAVDATKGNDHDETQRADATGDYDRRLVTGADRERLR